MRELAEDMRKNNREAQVRGQRTGGVAHGQTGAARVRYEWEVACREEIVGRADRCVYDVRRSGRNRVETTFQP